MRFKIAFSGASLLVFVSVVLAGCSSGSSGQVSGSGPAPQAATNVVAGPWTGMAASTRGAGTSVVIANLTDQGSGSFFSTNANTQVCQQFHPECIEDLPQESSLCCHYTVQGTVASGSVITVTIVVADALDAQFGSISVTGTLSSDGKSMSGTYSSTYTNGTAPDSGNFTAALAKSATGTYSGSLTSGVNSQVFPVTASITEAADGTITGTGSVSNSSCVATMTFLNQGQEHSFAIGGGFRLWAMNPTTQTIVYADVIPNGDGTYAVFWGIQTPTCGDGGTGTIK